MNQLNIICTVLNYFVILLTKIKYTREVVRFGIILNNFVQP